jgi:hypothetical protein
MRKVQELVSRPGLLVAAVGTALRLGGTAYAAKAQDGSKSKITACVQHDGGRVAV